MPHHRDTIASSLEPSELFSYLADFSNAAEWDPGTVGAKRLDDGPLRRGSRFELIVRFAGRESPFVYEIVEYDPPRRVKLRAETGAAVVTDEMTVAAGRAGSLLAYDARLELKGARKLLTPVMSPLFARVFREGRQGLEATIGRGAD